MEEKCFYHGDAPAVARCANCGAPVCASCKCTVNGQNVCPSCYEAALKQNLFISTQQCNINLGYLFFALVFYVAAVIVLSVCEFPMAFLGFLLAGIPNLLNFFKRQYGIFATVNGWFVILLLLVVFGIVTTPVLLIINVIKLIKSLTVKKLCKNQLVECYRLYPFLING